MKCYVHSRGSAHSCVQLTGMPLQYVRTPQSVSQWPWCRTWGLTYLGGQDGGDGKRCIQYIRQNELCL